MPRLGVGMPITAGLSQEAVTTIDDFFFESNTSGEVTPMLTTSRTNLINYSEDFSQAGQIQNITLTASSTTSPAGTANGTKALSTDNNSKVSFTNLSFVAGTTYTVSIFCKNIDATSLNFFIYMGGAGGDITHNFTSQVNTSDWTRVSYTFVATGTNSSSQVQFARNLPSGESAFFWGFQLEQDGFVSAYIPTSGSTVTVSTTLNDTSEVWDFDSTDIALEADPEDEGFWEEGSNIVTNGDFATDSDWSKGTGWTISDGKAHADVSSTAALSQTLSTGAGNTYDVTLTISNLTAGSIQPQFGGTLATPTSANSNGTHNFKITATGSSSGLLLYALNTSAFSIDNITVKEYAITPLDV